MRPQSFYSLESRTVLIAVHAGTIQGITYEAGTVGTIERINDPGEGSGRIIHFTRSLQFDFACFNKLNWEILSHCAACHYRAIESDLTRCPTCMRPDYCRTCIETHNCTVPPHGASREPRHVRMKGK